MTGGRVAFDASVIVRAALGDSERALEWVSSVERRESNAVAPDLIWLEVGSALAGYVRRGRLGVDHGLRALSAALRLPLRTTAAAELALPAFSVALNRGLTIYDASYAVLAEAEDVVLVTADRQLAEAVERAELIA